MSSSPKFLRFNSFLFLVIFSASFSSLNSGTAQAILPIMRINTFKQEIIPTAKASVQIELEENKKAPPLEFKAKLKIKGHLSRKFSKKSYALKLKEATSLLGLRAGKGYVLHGPYLDRSLIRNRLTLKLAEQMGEFMGIHDFVPQMTPIELYLDETYQGIYYLSEKIERGGQRLAIDKYDGSQAETSSFIMRINGYNEPTNSWETPAKTYIQYVYPDQEDLQEDLEQEKISSEQRSLFFKSIQQSVINFEAALKSADFKDPLKGYAPLIDKKSFLHFILVQELTRNVDGYRKSLYFFRASDQLLHLGPIWDFDLAYGNFFFEGSSHGLLLGTIPRHPFFSYFFVPETFWFKRLMKDPAFANDLHQYYHAMREPSGPLTDSKVLAELEREVIDMGEATQRNFQLWPVLNQPFLHLLPSYPPFSKTHQQEIAKMTKWIISRLHWLDENL